MMMGAARGLGRVVRAGLLLGGLAGVGGEERFFGVASARGAEVSFRREIAPLLHARCEGCHGSRKQSGGYRLDTYAAMLQPGESGLAPWVAGMPDESQVMALVTAEDDEDRMPQKDDRLTSGQIELIRRWIAEGCVFDGADPQLPWVLEMDEPEVGLPPAAYPEPFPITCVEFVGKGEQIVAGGYHELTVWDTRSGKLERRIGGFGQRVSGMDYAPAGGWLAVASGTPGRRGEVAVCNWSKPEASTPHRIMRLLDVAPVVRFSKDGAWLAVGTLDGSVRLFKVEAGVWSEERVIRQHADAVTDLDWDGGNGVLISCSRDRTVRVFEPGSWELKATHAEHGRPVAKVRSIGNDGRVLSLDGTGRIHVWNQHDPSKLLLSKTLRGFSGTANLANDILLVYLINGAVEGYRLGTLEFVGRLKVDFAWAHSLDGVSDSELFAVGTHDGRVWAGDWKSWSWIGNFLAVPRPGAAEPREGQALD